MYFIKWYVWFTLNLFCFRMNKVSMFLLLKFIISICGFMNNIVDFQNQAAKIIKKNNLNKITPMIVPAKYL